MSTNGIVAPGVNGESKMTIQKVESRLKKQTKILTSQNYLQMVQYTTLLKRTWSFGTLILRITSYHYKNQKELLNNAL